MNAKKLYAALENDFIKPGLHDDWTEILAPVSNFITDNFKKRSVGLVCDNSKAIKKVYTAVFPSKEVMHSILDRGETEVLLFVHHPAIWDIRKNPVFYTMDIDLLKQFRERRISIYNLHVPLDNFGEYSTSVNLARALRMQPEKAFAPYFGGLCGVFATTAISTAQGLKKKFESAVGHNIHLYDYGTNAIDKNKVAVIAGGGNNVDMLKEIVHNKINTLVTGITVVNSHSQKAHDYAQLHKINILGGTHYSTEKFACIALCSYFKKHDLPSLFIPNTPVFEDM